jgi:hypothetical protein
MDTQQVAKVGIDLFLMHDPLEYRIDEIGLGAGVVDATKKVLAVSSPEKRGRIKPIHVGMDAKNKNEFVNLRAEMFWQVRYIIDQISIPFATPLLDEELTSIKYGWDNKDKRQKIESKDSIRSSLGRSCNDADAFCLNVADFRIQVGVATSQYFKLGSTLQYDLAHDSGNSRIPTTVTSLQDFVERRSGGSPFGINRFAQFRETDRSVSRFGLRDLTLD